MHWLLLAEIPHPSACYLMIVLHFSSILLRLPDQLGLIVLAGYLAYCFTIYLLKLHFLKILFGTIPVQ